jgi:hypothetical protein
MEQHLLHGRGVCVCVCVGVGVGVGVGRGEEDSSDLYCIVCMTETASDSAASAQSDAAV